MHPYHKKIVRGLLSVSLSCQPTKRASNTVLGHNLCYTPSGHLLSTTEELEGTSEGLWTNALLQALPALAAQGFVQLNFALFARICRSHNLPGALLQCLTTLTMKSLFLTAHQNFPHGHV